MNNVDALRRKAGEFRNQAAETIQDEYRDKLLKLAHLYEMRADLVEENEALRRGI